MRKVSLLHEDIDAYLREWKNNHKASIGQKALWPQNRKITRTLLSKKAKRCLRLLEEDGHNGKAVGSMSESHVKKWFEDYGDQHKIPPVEDLIRFGVFFHLGFYKTLALVMKRCRERFCAKKSDNLLGRDLFDTLKDIKQAQELVPEFNNYLKGKFDLPYLKREFDLAGLFEIFESQGNLVSKARYDAETFKILVEHMITSEMHLFANNSLELSDFIEKEQLEKEILHAASKDESEEFWIKKCCWLELKNETGNLLLKLENQRLRNENVVQQWMAIFGQPYLALTELESKYYYLQRIIQIKDADEDITLGEAQDIEEEKRLQEEEALEKLKMEIALADITERWKNEGSTAGGEELSEYDSECKSILREIWRLTHPDGISQQRFTENQKKKLADFFEMSIKIREEEIGLYRRPLNILLDILAGVKDIWEEMGLDINPENTIKGEILKEKIDFLEARILSLEEEVKQIRAGIYILIQDDNIKEKQSCLATEQQKTDLLKQMEDKKDYYKEQIDIMESRIEELFGEEVEI